MGIQEKNFINEIKKLKSIKADDGFKFALRKRMFGEAGRSFVINMADSRLHNQQASNLHRIFNNLLPRKQNMFLPLLLIIALLGGGAGATYASQSSLPGDVLYPVKMATEKVQTVLNVNNDAKEANLHIKFSEERLSEVDKLAQKGKTEPKLIREGVDNYKKELAEAKNLLANTSSDLSRSTQIAQNLADATNQNKEVLVKISGEVDSDEALDILKDAWKEAVNYSDIAKLELLKKVVGDATADANVPSAANTVIDVNATNTTNTTNAVATDAKNQTITNTTTAVAPVQDQQSQIMVANKIAEASHKISEAEKYITKKESQGADVSAAKTKIAEAKTLIADAQNLLDQAKYVEAFLKAKDAHQAAEIAKESLENEYKREHNKKEDLDDEENIFILPTDISNNNSTFNSANNEVAPFGSATTNNASNQAINSHEANEKKNEAEEENKNSRRENKSEGEHKSEDRD